ncbi:unnamed protein product [Leptidea sinapis]|uniref:Vitellogenin domain-containing protein n=1 Tax=Leptidea sinapis TaxID=189913 RepID=A0A5E4R8I7_9NEOP|nr:unnamed protein product [Leptidea sinapis]
MKVLVLAVLIVAVSSGRLDTQANNPQTQFPWQVGKLYKYEVLSHTLANLPEGASTGSFYKGQFVIRVKAPGRLQARFENPTHATVHQNLHKNDLPEDNSFQPVANLDKPFEIIVDGGRVSALNFPAALSLANENLLKGLIGSLQIDLSPHRNIHSPRDTYDSAIQQGQFRKMETDVTGDCETLYTVSPVASEWRRELPKYKNDEEPFEITKSKSYGHCHHRVDYHFGVPESAEWTGTAHNAKEDQLIKRSTVSRFLVGKNGPIYSAKTTSTVNVNPHMYGEQQAEVHSEINLKLVEHQADNQPEWEQPEGGRAIQNLLYSLSSKQVTIDETSSSTSSESQERTTISEEQPSRVRRSSKSQSKQVNVAITKNIIRGHSQEHDSSQSSSSSSDSASAFVNDDIPKESEPAYAALYMSPQPRVDKKQNPMNAQKLLQELAQQLQNPSNMPKADFLSKFNILVRIVASMSYSQLVQTSRSIEIAKSHADEVKNDMWMIYRDAVTQAGTLPAFQMIRTWIQEKKIEGEEAAEVVAVLSRTLRYPTKDAMTQFFNLALSPEVKQQSNLNTTALLAATKFIHMGQVDNRTAHRYYPTHMYGRFSDKNDGFVLNEILPRLSQELRQSVEQGDSHKAQVYTKAIGNLGHREILQVFAPYLEGKVPVSTFLRAQMIESLRTLASEKDRYVRAVLYSILRNTAEPYEVRVAAILNILIGHPTGAMMQALADMTKTDPSIEVRAAIKSAIENAADLKHPRFFELARSAQAVRGMLTKERFGKQNSKIASLPQYEDNDDVGTLGVLSTIGAEDSVLPKFLRFNWLDRVGSWNRESAISGTVSSWQTVTQFVKEFLYKDKRQSKTGAEHKYSADKIAEIFNIQYQKEPAEASLYVNFMNQQRFFAFSEEDLKQMPEKLFDVMMDLNSGMQKHYTKVINKDQVYIMFPVASGMPFIYRFKKPAVIHMLSKSKGQFNPSNGKLYGSMNRDISFVYAENHDGSVGFLDTISSEYASVGVVGKLQLYIPLNINVDIKSGEVKVQLSPINSEQDSNILHYSIWPYSANQKKDTLVTISQDPTTKLINRNEKASSVDYRFGQQMGTQFQVNGYSYSNDFRNVINLFQSRDLLSHVLTPFNLRDVSQTHFNLRYLGKQSNSKGVTVIAAYDALYNQKLEGEMPSVASDVADASPNSQARRDELVKRVVTGIKSARAYVLDISAQFQTPQKLEYVFTSVVGQSDIDPKTQYAVFAGRNSAQHGNTQINAVGKLVRPKSANLNYAQALKNDIKMTLEADIRSGQKDNIHIQANAERTQKYVEALQQQPSSQKCLEDSAKNNYYQPACQSMIIYAQVPDSYKLSATYNLNPSAKNIAFQVYRIMRVVAPSQSAENPQKALPDGKLEMTFDWSHLAQYAGMALSSRYGELNVRNIHVSPATSHLMSVYQPIGPMERVLNYYTRNQYQPHCSVDGSKIRTFSGRQYNYALSRNWHLVMYNKADNSDDLVVLARRPNRETART